ncbi:serine hydrolase [Phenylobacterium sp.]|uniref:serine hydrolase domain-containing protein n=1 Tax=Phenylobacterium sp. TaxID=1871053 RepID=UPI0027354305|nr:serine hydrolase domain-containing protein [Phenylobacterium sp.]MDP3633084.1 serine hydrolase domain-containing protein [Phenylobacterium sp.]
MDAIEKALGAVVAAGELAGVVGLVWRGGEARVAAVGWRDIEAGLPMQRDSIFRIASMSKPIVSAAAMTMLQEGRFSLEDPISRVAPEFLAMRVLRDPDGPLDDTTPADRQITFEDLLTHRAGLTQAGFHTGPIDAAHREALGPDLDSPLSPDAWIAGLAALPLVGQPGAAFTYGRSTDLLGLLLGRMEGAPLEEVLRHRVFEPLGMTDTGFSVPAEKRHRRAGLYGFDMEGRLKKLPTVPGGAALPERPDDMEFASGGAGLWSTVDDYLAFARTFVDGGLLSPQTLALMTTNRLIEAQRLGTQMFGMPTFGPGCGFGLGVAVTMDPATAPVIRGKGGAGTVGWPGAYGGWWQADPTERSVAILLMHNMLELEQLTAGYGLGGYGAIMAFHALATA